MKLEEKLASKCEKCIHNSKSENNSPQKSNENNNESSDNSVVVAKCLDCDQSMCSNCLLEHQNEFTEHKISTLSVSPMSQTTDDSAAILAAASSCGLNDVDLLSKINDLMNSNSMVSMLKSNGLLLNEEDDYSALLMNNQNSSNLIHKRRQSNSDLNEFVNNFSQSNNSQDHHSIKRRKESVLDDEHQNVVSSQSQMVMSQPHQQQQQMMPQIHVNASQQQQSSNKSASQSQPQQQQQQNNRLMQIENEINKTFNFYVQSLRERKEYLIKELNTIVQYALLNHSQNINKQAQIQYQLEMKKSALEKELTDYYDLLNSANGEGKTADLKNFDEFNLKSKLNTLTELNGLTQVNNQLINQLKNSNPLMPIEFISNFSAIQTSIRNTFGFIRINQQQHQTIQQQQQQNEAPVTASSSSTTITELKPSSQLSQSQQEMSISPVSMKKFANMPHQGIMDDELMSNMELLTDSMHQGSQQQQLMALASASSKHQMFELATGGCALKNSIQLQRKKMIYHCKFGEFGVNDGQFTEPSGVTINTNNDIIVADTNSHRIQIFDREGNFKFKFGECGKRDGQLLYPNRVSIVRQTGDIVVTERSPTHQIQIYNKFGQFLRKFGASILQHPRGVYVDYKGRIVVVECKVMRVIIFDLYGNVLNKFNCSKYLEFPNGVCCSNPNASNNYREEIYISDNRAHCIKVFDYNGTYLRQIGGEGITNYPIGVGINSNNEILVADNHNNFNLTVFTQDGKLVNALESKVKHAQCFDVGLMDDGSIVLASKDYRIYVYKYSSNLMNIEPITSQSMHHLSILSPTSQCSSNSACSSTTTSTSNLHAHLQQSSASQIPKFDLFSDTNNNSIPFGSTSSNSNSNSLYNLLKSNKSESSLIQNNAISSSNPSTTAPGSSNFNAFFNDFSSNMVDNLLCSGANKQSNGLFGNETSNSLLDNFGTNLLNQVQEEAAHSSQSNNIASILNGIL